ncbi:hypothetical protein JCM10207_002510 [Rhodosporidiobolus poonsookiae]
MKSATALTSVVGLLAFASSAAAAPFSLERRQFTVKGIAPPISVDAVSAADTSTLLEHIANLTASTAVNWNVDLAIDEQVIFRVTDSAGRVVQSDKRKVKDGNGKGCRKLNPTWWEQQDLGYQIFFAIYMIILGGWALAGLIKAWTLWRKRKQPAAAPAGDVELLQNGEGARVA